MGLKESLSQFEKFGVLLITVIMVILSVNGCEHGGGSSPVIIVPDDVASIHQAIEILPDDGGTIYIKAGTYVLSQGIHINRSNVTVLGEKGTVIKLGSSVNQPLILIGSDEQEPDEIVENIKIQNLVIDGNKDFQDSETDPDRDWLRNNCIDVRMVNNLRISEVDVHDARSGGLVISWDSRNIFIDKSSFYNNYYDGIALYASEDIQISSFLCYENNAAGLSLDNNLKNVLFNGGIIKKNKDVGIFARHSEDLVFNALIVMDNQSHGSFLSHAEASNTGVRRLFFSGCSFIDNKGYGLWLASPKSESPSNTVIGCLFSGNTDGAIEVHEDGELNEEANVFD